MNEDALLRSFEPNVRAAAGGLYLVNGDDDDLLQFGRLGALQAIRTHRPGLAPLPAFVSMCARRQMVTAVRMSHAGKHSLMNQRLHAVRPDEDGEWLDPLDLAVDPHGDPYDRLVVLEELRRVRRAVERLSPLERRALGMVLDGVPYTKSIDNAIQRARRKLRTAA